ncbi:MAG: sulfotransferase domain-containing protein [Planctomycetales bacterium]|nr:sulfotransferase domain-containing protein [Planctomycetales bacterium]
MSRGTHGNDEPSLTLQEAWKTERPITRLLRRVACNICTLPDSGWLGLTPLRTHILICGLPRSGSTLLQLMMDTVLPAARKFKKEIRGWRAATSRLRNHAVMLTKRPRDILEIGRVRAFYADRDAALRVIVTIRDPRDALTSRHPRSAKHRPYHISTAVWHELYPALLRQVRDDRNMVVRYEQLVADTGRIELDIERFVGERFAQPFSQFQDSIPHQFKTGPLNGIRAVDTSSVGRWQAPEHEARIGEILHDVPDFAQHLIELGYETDAAWAAPYVERRRAA